MAPGDVVRVGPAARMAEYFGQCGAGWRGEPVPDEWTGREFYVLRVLPSGELELASDFDDEAEVWISRGRCERVRPGAFVPPSYCACGKRVDGYEVCFACACGVAS